MWNDAYLESRVLAADPIELVGILYEGAMEAVAQARRHLAEGRIAERSAAISKAVAILGELASSLNHQEGREISRRLAQLYDYLQGRLLEANFRQAAEPLEESLRLLRVLAEGWQGVRAQISPARPEPVHAASPWSGAAMEEPAAGYARQAWSL
jgi:flagellar protein FliS